MNRREFLSGTVAAALAAGSITVAEGTSAQPPVVGRSSKTKPWAEIPVRRIKTRSAKQFRCIQVTDLHQFHTTPEDDNQTFSDIQKYVGKWEPDLLIATGDLWHDNDHGEGPRGVERLVAEFEKIGVPWTVLWGNHDRLDNYQAGHDAFSSAAHSVYGGAWSHGDYRVEVAGADGEIPVMDFICLNSNHEGLGPWQVEALKTMIGQVKARGIGPGKGILFHHIPMLELKTRLNSETFRGLKLEDVASLQDQGRTFPLVQEAGFIRACFCGHNHVNDYALNLGQVSLNYGRSTGHAGYGGERLRKGAKWIEVDLGSGEVQAATVFPDGSRLA